MCARCYGTTGRAFDPETDECLYADDAPIELGAKTASGIAIKLPLNVEEIEWKVKCRATVKDRPAIPERGLPARPAGPCRSWAIRGGTTCKAHGGMFPSVKVKADARIRQCYETLVEKGLPVAVTTLIHEAENATDARDRINASNSIADRAGLPKKDTRELAVEVTVSPAEELLKRIGEIKRRKDAITAKFVADAAADDANTVDAELVEEEDE